MDVHTSNVVFTQKELETNEQEEIQFQKKYRKELLKAEDRRRKNELKELKESNKYISDRKKKCTSTKIFMYFIMLNCTAVELYSMVVMYVVRDLSALYALIGAVIGESVSYAIYCAKSFNDSKEEAKSKLERDKFNASLESTLSDTEQQIINEIIPDPIPDSDDHSGDIPDDVIMEEVHD